MVRATQYAGPGPARLPSMSPFEFGNFKFELRISSLIECLLDHQFLGRPELRDECARTLQEDRIAAVVGRPSKAHALGRAIVELDGATAPCERSKADW